MVKKKGRAIGSPRKHQPAPSANMAKWTLRSKSWCFTCTGAHEATLAGAAFRSAAKAEKYYRLDVTVPVQVVTNGVVVTWAQPVVGKTVMGWLYSNKVLKDVLGPGKPSHPIHWAPCGVAARLGLPTTASTNAAGMPMAAPKPPNQQEGYPDLPSKYQEASLGPQDWFGTVADPGKPKRMLEQFGFLVLRGFVTDNVATPACESVLVQFRKVMGSLTDGHATQDFDKLAALPAKVWEYKAHSEDPIVTCHFPKIGERGSRQILDDLGCSFNAGGSVTFVKHGGGADKQGVKLGWQILNIDGQPFKHYWEHTMSHEHSGMNEQGHLSLPNKKTEMSPFASSKRIAKPLARGTANATTTKLGLQVKFKKMHVFSKFALEQKWSVSQNAGYLRQFGGGKLTKPQFFLDMLPLREAQLYMRLA